MFRIASFDIGYKNFAQYVEEFDSEKLTKLQQEYSKFPRRSKTRYASEKFNILEQVCLCGTRIQTGVYKFEEGDKYTLFTRFNVLAHLEKYSSLWDICDIIIIEEQFFKTGGWGRGRNKGSAANIKAIKIAEGILMWFLDRYGASKVIEYFPSKYKTDVFGVKERDKKKRKEWATHKAREIYTLREDGDIIEVFALQDRIYRRQITTEEKVQSFLGTYKGVSPDARALAEKVVRERQKLDDIGDAIVQAQAFKFKNFVDVKL